MIIAAVWPGQPWFATLLGMAICQSILLPPGHDVITSPHHKANHTHWQAHRIVTKQLLKGALNKNPPQPRYSGTWDINVVLEYSDRTRLYIYSVIMVGD